MVRKNDENYFQAILLWLIARQILAFYGMRSRHGYSSVSQLDNLSKFLTIETKSIIFLINIHIILCCQNVLRIKKF